MIRADVIVVLGCRVAADGRPSASLARRIRLAARAFDEGVADCILASGGRAWHGHSEARCIRDGLVAQQVPGGAIRQELCSLTTLENAYYCQRWMQSQRMRSALLCTCPWHLPRARRSFERFGAQVVLPPACWHEPQPRPPRHALRERLTDAFDCALLGAFRAGSLADRGMPPEEVV